MQTATERSTWPVGESEMAARIRAFDWAATPLGPVEGWPERLKTAVGMILPAPLPMWIGWGPELIQLYNDGYTTLLDAERHPALLGQPAAAGWAEIWHLVAADFEAILGGGPAVSYADRHVPYRRHGEIRDLTFTYSYSPILDADAPNGVGGVLCVAIETTERVLAEEATRESEARNAFLLALGDQLRSLSDPGEIMSAAAEAFGRHLGLSVVQYLAVEEDGDRYRVMATHGDGRLPRIHEDRGRISDHGADWAAQFHAGREIFSDDHATRPGDAEESRAFGVRSGSAVPLIKGGRLVAIFSTGHPEPRRWTDAEKALQREVAERTWEAAERARTEAALRESEIVASRFATLADASTEFVGMCDEQLNPLYINPAGLRLVGLDDLGHARQQSVLDFFFPEDQPFIRDTFLPQVLRDGHGEVEIRFRHFGTGEALWVIYSVVSLLGAGGMLTGYGTVTRNITARKQAERELRESEERQAFLLGLSDALRSLSDPEEIAEVACRLLADHLSSNLGGTPLFEEDPDPVVVRFVVQTGSEPSTGQAFVAADLGNLASVPEPLRAAYRAHRMRAIASIPIVQNGRLVATLGVISTVVPAWSPHDVRLFRQVAERVWAAVERGRGDLALRESEARLRLALDVTELGTWSWDLATGEGEVDPRGAEIVGLRAGVFPDIAAAQAAHTHPDDLAGVHAATAAGIAGGEPFTLSYRAVHPDGAVRHVSSRVRVLTDANGRPSRLVGTIRDVTAEREAEAALRESERHHAFLLRLFDALRPLADPEEIMGAASRLLADHLGVDRAVYADVTGTPGDERAVVRSQDGAAAPKPYGLFGAAVIDALRRGEAVAVEDVSTDPRFTAESRAVYAASGIAAFVAVSLVKEGRWEMSFGVHNTTPRAWTPSEIDLVGEVAERTWAAAARAAAEAALRASETRLRALVMASANVIYRMSPDWSEMRQLDGGGFLVDTGEPRRDWLDVYIEPDDRPAVLAAIEAAIHARGLFELEHRVRRADGSIGWTLSRAVPILDADGEIVEWFGAASDVTERRRAEEALRESEERFRTIWEATSEALAISGPDGTVRAANPAYLELYGFDEAEVVGHSFAIIFPEEQRASAEEQHRATFAVPEPPPAHQAVVRRLDGSERIVEARADFVLEGDRRVAMVSAIRDVTDRVAAEEALRASENRLRRMINIEGVGVLVFDMMGGTLIDANDHFLAMTGYTRQAVERGELSWRAMTPPEHVEESEAQMRRLASEGRIGPYEKEYLLADGGRSWMLLAGAAVGDGTVVEYCIDVSDRKRAEESLRQAEAALRESEARHAFLLRLTDALRQVAGSEDQQRVACMLLGEHLGVDRVQYAEHDIDEGIVVVLPDYTRSGAASLAGTYRVERFGESLPLLRAGRTVVIADTQRDPLFSEPARATYRELAIGAYITAPLVSGGELAWTLTVISDTPRAWTAGEVALVEEVGERTWTAVERGHAEADLAARVRAATAELRAVSRRLLEVQEEERRHLARELHDEIGQMLTGLSLNLRPGVDGGDERLEEARRIVHELTHQVRQLSMELRPSALDSHGLLPALLWHIDRFQDRTGVTVDLRHEGLDRRFSPAVEIAAYRIVQEALTNVARHAGVRRATVQLLVAGDVLIVSVRDRGRGIDGSASVETAGISGMRERVRLVGGSLSLDTAPGEGTVVTAELPIDETREDP